MSPRRDTSRASQADECKGAKSTKTGSKEACPPSGLENQGVGTINSTSWGFEATNPTAGGSEVALGSAEIVCKDQGVADASHRVEKTRECARMLSVVLGNKTNLI